VSGIVFARSDGADDGDTAESRLAGDGFGFGYQFRAQSHVLCFTLVIFTQV